MRVLEAAVISSITQPPQASIPVPCHALPCPPASCLCVLQDASSQPLKPLLQLLRTFHRTMTNEKEARFVSHCVTCPPFIYVVYMASNNSAFFCIAKLNVVFFYILGLLVSCCASTVSFNHLEPPYLQFLHNFWHPDKKFACPSPQPLFPLFPCVALPNSMPVPPLLSVSSCATACTTSTPSLTPHSPPKRPSRASSPFPARPTWTCAFARYRSAAWDA